jgi:predicted amidohydrolase YtcJ
LTTGLIDAHAHLALHGRAMSMLSLAECSSREACLERIAAAAASADAASRGAWVVGAGMRAEGWADPRPLTAGELDAAGAGRPEGVAVWSFDHHAICASSAALAAAGISRDTPDPTGGMIVRDGAGNPTGLLLESAAHLLWGAVPEPTADERRMQVLAAARDFARRGIVEVHDMHAPLWLGPLLAEMDEAGELPISVVLYVPLAEVETAAREAPGWTRERVRLAGAKIFVDGTLNSRTAWMLSEYADPLPGLPCGKAMMAPGEIEAAVRRTEGLGLALAAHAIGDAAVRAVLDAVEATRVPPRVVPPSPGGVAGQPSAVHEPQAGTTEGHRSRREAAPHPDLGRSGAATGAHGRASLPPERNEARMAGSARPPGTVGVPRHRIEHAEIIDKADVGRFKALGVVCSPQPCHLLADIEALRRLLPHRLHRVLPLRELIDSGLTPGVDLLFGSDAPIVEPSPRNNVIAATLRRREGMAASEAIGPEQAITEEEAWAAMRTAWDV